MIRSSPEAPTVELQNMVAEKPGGTKAHLKF
jgi:hypothetical protein